MNRPHDELFHEEYEYVAVMFASLAGYSLHDDEAGAEEDGLQDDGIGGLKLLNEIITDFDKVGVFIFMALTYFFVNLLD
jgi:hypothetical protein